MDDSDQKVRVPTPPGPITPPPAPAPPPDDDAAILAQMVGNGGPLVHCGDRWFFRNSQTNALLPVDEDPRICRLLERYMLDLITEIAEAGLLIKTVRAYTVLGALDHMPEECQGRVHRAAAERVSRLAHVREYYFQNFATEEDVVAEMRRRDHRRGHGFIPRTPCRGMVAVWGITGRERRRLVALVHGAFDAYMGERIMAVAWVEEIPWSGDPLLHLIVAQERAYPPVKQAKEAR